MSLCSHCLRSLEKHSSHGNSPELAQSNSHKRKEKPYVEYNYDDLKISGRSVRILKLLGTDSRDAEVVCELSVIEFDRVKPLKNPYEALSWCWGNLAPDGRIFIRNEGKDKKRRVVKYVSPELVAALRALRYQRKDRFLWIDQVCINQKNPIERNHQVEMMAEIYRRATQVCIWLGEGNPSSRMALKFIKKEVLQLQNFDELCESEQATKKWGALLELMQRPWFSRRWVVQEIALAHSAMIYCGAEKIPWKKFAVAVELFVEVETATHRLSEVMKKDPLYYHVPGWFEYVSALGASLLVEATGKLFRDYKPNGPISVERDSDEEDESDAEESDAETASQSDAMSVGAADSPDDKAEGLGQPPHRQPLLTLEYLVSSLSIFEVTTPHDAIYALLAIAKDTTPVADDQRGLRRQLVPTQKALERFTQSKRYTVDYQKPFTDMCKDFVAFCIEYSKDPTRALDIICRPWAPDLTTEDLKIHRRTRPKRNRSVEQDRHSHEQFPLNKKARKGRTATNSTLPNTRLSRHATWLTDNLDANQVTHRVQEEIEKDVLLPAWIPTLSGAAHAMLPAAGVHTLKLVRKNADSLVGLPPGNQALERNYNATERRGISLDKLRFVKRSVMDHWSMYAEGFILDEVAEIQPSSQGGAIPRSWAKAGGWTAVMDKDPPDEFWRTLVADRGRDGRNPPVYYSRACKESFLKGGISSGSVNTTDLINNERCSVIAQFCRRVQAVIWNRSLIKTRSGKLGLVGQEVKHGDLVCILYGCSVPVVVHRVRKSEQDVRGEMEDDFQRMKGRIEALYDRVADARRYRRSIRHLDWILHSAFELRMQKTWAEDIEGRSAWQTRYAAATIRQDETYPSHYHVTMEGEPDDLVIATSKIENAERLLERRAYRKWREVQRQERPDRKFKREDRRIDEMYLHWGRIWRRNFKRKKQLAGDHRPSNCGATNTSRSADLQTAKEIFEDWERRFKDDYLAPYLNAAGELREPDWNRRDEESIRMQDQWSYYKFLGECYVHGMMDGEAMGYQNENGIPAKVFELR